MSELRTALSEIMHATHGLPCDGAPDAILVRIRGIANDALNVTAGSTDMEKLVAWLEIEDAVALDMMTKCGDHATKRKYSHRRGTIRLIQSYIRTVFYGEGE